MRDGIPSTLLCTGVMNSIPMFRKLFNSIGSSFPSIDAYDWAPAALSEVVEKRAVAVAILFTVKRGGGSQVLEVIARKLDERWDVKEFSRDIDRMICADLPQTCNWNVDKGTMWYQDCACLL